MRPSIVSELKRRNVFKVAGAYLLVAWLMLQVAGSLENALELPRWFDGFIVAALALFFPVALIIAWAFELTAEGVKRTAAVDGEEGRTGAASRAASAALLLVALLGGAGIAAYWAFTTDAPLPLVRSEQPAALTTDSAQRTELPTADIDSLAVLPMISLGAEDDSLERLGIGISDELRNVLARVSGVRVASRPSSMAYSEADRPGAREIAQNLGVSYILDGNLQAAGETLRVSVQLIRASNDAQVMSRRFDLPLSVDNIFAVQDQIATEVATSLGRTLGESARDALRFVAAGATDSLPAYKAYLEGRMMFAERNRVTNPEDFAGITRRFEDATQMDPDFGHAWAALAMQYVTTISWGGDEAILRERARIAAQRALELDDKLALAHAVLGVTAALPDGRIDRVAAIDGLDRAIDLDPFEPALWSWRGQHWIELGFFNRGVEDLSRTIDLTLLDGVANFWTINAYLQLGEFDLAASRTPPFAASAPRFNTLTAIAMKGRASDEELRAELLDPEDNRQLRSLIAAALTESDFDFPAGYEAAQLAVRGDENLERLITHPIMLYVFKRYEQLPREAPLSGRLTWWHSAHSDFLRSPIRYGYFHDLGLADYWRARGFPPRCLEDDSAAGFSCD